MELPEGKQALREVKLLEEELDRRLKEARRAAKETVDAARAGADTLLRRQENELEQLRCRLDVRAHRVMKNEGAKLPAGFAPDSAVVDAVAKDLFNIITGR